MSRRSRARTRMFLAAGATVAAAVALVTFGFVSGWLAVGNPQRTIGRLRPSDLTVEPKPSRTPTATAPRLTPTTVTTMTQPTASTTTSTEPTSTEQTETSVRDHDDDDD
jgi:hypothetical protein